MPQNNSVIKICVLYEDKEYSLETYVHEYRNLMMLIYDKVYLENFGECKGIGRCGTCHIHIEDPGSALLNKVRNETTTLSKMPFVQSNSRLACQMMIDESLHGVTVRIVNETI